MDASSVELGIIRRYNLTFIISQMVLVLVTLALIYLPSKVCTSGDASHAEYGVAAN
jgi:hypothetical protein